MEITWRYIYCYILLNIVRGCRGLPINVLSAADGWNLGVVLMVTITITVSAVTILVGCVCCQRKQGFKVFRDSPVSASGVSERSEEEPDPGHVNPIATSEFTIFTPLSQSNYNNNVFQQTETRGSLERIPEAIGKSDLYSPEIASWFDGTKVDFPRHKLRYIRELGNGWFGRAVEGEAQGISEDPVWTPVAVRILESCASVQEQSLFLHEAALYRLDEHHPNVVKLLGYCIQTTPFLLIQEYCSRGDLKKFLLENKSNCTDSLMMNLPLRFSCQITSAIQYLHKNHLVHPDLATRTCQLSHDLTPKLGDYGLAVAHYPADYYQGVPAIPVRWSAPEILNFTTTTLQPKPMTVEANVWSLGVTLWEMCEWGSQPYETLTDDDVISCVLAPPHVRLPKPTKFQSFYIDHLYQLMQLCWKSAGERPKIDRIYDMLIHLLQISSNGSPLKTASMEDFDNRWDCLKPNTIVKIDNQSDEIVVDGSSMSSAGEPFLGVKKTESLTNLHGSFENLLGDESGNVELDSWLQNVASDTGDMQYVKGLSQAIYELDSALASEQTSSSSSSYQSPEQAEHRKIEFKLGCNAGVGSDGPSSLMDSILYVRNESGSETEDETWKRRIERGAYSEKVRQKSKSVTDLMVLTHIDCSDTDSETPLQSLEWKSTHKNVRCASRGPLDSSMIYGSEGNLLEVQNTFQEELRKLQEERRDSLLFVPTPPKNESSPRKIDVLLSGNVEAKFHIGLVQYDPKECRSAFEAAGKVVEDDSRNVSIEDSLVETKIVSEIFKENPVTELQGEICVENVFFSKPPETETVIVSAAELPKEIVENVDDVFMTNDENLQCVVENIIDDDENTVFSKLPETESGIVTEIFEENSVVESQKEVGIENIKDNLKTVVENIVGDDKNMLSSSPGIASEIFTENPIAETRKEISFENDNVSTAKEENLQSFVENIVPEDETLLKDPVIENETSKKVVEIVNDNVSVIKNIPHVENIVDDKIQVSESDIEPIPNPVDDSGKVVSEISVDNLVGETKTDIDIENTIDNVSPAKTENYEPFSMVFEDEINETEVENLNEMQKEIDDVSTDFKNGEKTEPKPVDVSEISFSLNGKMYHFDKNMVNSINEFLDYERRFSQDRELTIDRTQILNTQNLIDLNAFSPSVQPQIFNVFNVTVDHKPPDFLNITYPDNKRNGFRIIDDASPVKEDLKLFTSTPYVNREKSDYDQSSVILGPCEEYTLELYSGLKTTLDSYYDDRSEEEALKFSSNFMPFDVDSNVPLPIEYSLDTWDKFLVNSLRENENVYTTTPTLDSLKLDETFKLENDDGAVTSRTADNNLIENNECTENEIEINETYDVPVAESPSDATYTIDTSVKNVGSCWEPGEGWFLHPQTPSEDLTGQIDVQSEEIDSSYVGFTLDEESENALRNELVSKLPHAQGLIVDEDEPEEWDSAERNEMIVRYNVYATPLSPIPEESCCDDMFCDQTKHRDDSGSDWSGSGRISPLEDILVVDTETHTAHILESPSPKEPLNRHTPSQDSCCSNDTLFNLEDLNFGTADAEASPTHDEARPEPPEIPDILNNNNVDKSEPLDVRSEENLTYTIEKDPMKLHLSLEPISVNPPLPSPEDVPWRQLPVSMLTYNEVALQQEEEAGDAESIDDVNDIQDAQEDFGPEKDMSVEEEAEYYNNLTDIRFVGPGDAQLMSTSFSESAEIAENDKDWDSGSDTRSSSSGEFIWKEGDHEENLRALHHNETVPESVAPMDAIVEEKSDTSDDDEYDEIEETEFIPSAWDSQATPTKSALRSPEKSNKNKVQKGVWFKKEKYHCVYEYPREPESPITQADLWQPMSDAYSDLWELDPEQSVAPFEESVKDSYESRKNFTPCDFYQLAGCSFPSRLYPLNSYSDFSTGAAVPDEDFFISSSTKPFQSLTQGSQFFPGISKPSQWEQQPLSGRELSDNITPDSGIDDATPASVSDLNYLQENASSNGICSLKSLAALALEKSGQNLKCRPEPSMATSESLGGLRHTRNRLKLDLPPSPSSFTSTKNFNIELDTDPIVQRDVPTFTTFGKSRFSVQHVDTPTEDDLTSTNQPKNVSFEALPYKPQSSEQIKLICSDVEKPKQVEVVRGEASLLDSADEDSGIESSANATLERQQVLN